MKKIKLLVADDHPLFLDGLLSLLGTEKQFDLAGTAGNGKEVLDLVEKKSFDVCILDINMPVMNGIETARILRQRFPHIRIIILTTHSDKEFISEMLHEGIAGYVLKNSTRDQLKDAILKVAAGGTSYSSEVMETIVNDYTHKVKKEKQEKENAVVLTQRETEIVQLLAREYTNDDIADELCISYRTVETHRKNIMQKTGARNLAGLLKFAYSHGIIS